jgi:Ankyrin repeat.
MDAVMRGQADMVSLLLDKGANPNPARRTGPRCCTMRR